MTIKKHETLSTAGTTQKSKLQRNKKQQQIKVPSERPTLTSGFTLMLKKHETLSAVGTTQKNSLK